jgi:hypothetical protein
LNLVANKDIVAIAENAVAKVNALTPLKKPHKNKLYTYFSLTNDYVGIGFEKSVNSAIDFTSDKLNPLKALLEDVLATETAYSIE